MNYNIVAGTDDQTLNRVVGEVYKALYPSVFKDSVKGDGIVVDEVVFDMDKAPLVKLQVSGETRKSIRKQIDESGDDGVSKLPEEEKNRLVQTVAGSSFELEIPNFALTVKYVVLDDTKVSASLSLAVFVSTRVENEKPLLTIKAVAARISVPGNEGLEASINEVAVPLLLPFLNDEFLTPIEIPPLRYESFQVSLPVIAVQPPHVAAYSALGPVQPEIPAPHPWPGGCVFAGLDKATLNAAAALVFPIGPSAEFNWEIVSGHIRAQIMPPDLTIQGDGSISAVLSVNASAQLAAHGPWPFDNVAFGPSATASLNVGFKPSVENGHLVLVPTEVPMPSFDFSLGTVSEIVKIVIFPIWMGLEAALNAAIGPLIKSALEGVRITIAEIPVMPLEIAGKTITISLQEAASSAGGPGNALLLVSLQPKVS